MRITEEQAKSLFPDVIKSQEFKLTPEKQHYRYAEEQLQKSCVATFREMQEKGLFLTVPDLEDIEFEAIPQFGEKSKDKTKQIIQGQRNKAMGYKAGTTDAQIIWKLRNKNPRFGKIEFKAPEGSLSDSQRDYHPRLVKMNIPLAVVRTHDDFMKCLKRWKILPPCFDGMYS